MTPWADSAVSRSFLEISEDDVVLQAGHNCQVETDVGIDWITEVSLYIENLFI